MQGQQFKFLSSIYIYLNFILFILSYAYVKCALQMVNIIIKYYYHSQLQCQDFKMTQHGHFRTQK